MRDGLHCYTDDDDEANLSFSLVFAPSCGLALFVLARGVRGEKEHMARERERKKNTHDYARSHPVFPSLAFPPGVRKMRRETGEGHDSRKVGVTGGDLLRSACHKR